MAKLNIGNLEMRQSAIDWLRAIAALNGTTMKNKLTDAWIGHLTKHQEHYTRQIQYTAHRHGLSFDQCFSKLMYGEDLGDIINDPEIDINGTNTFTGEKRSASD